MAASFINKRCDNRIKSARRLASKLIKRSKLGGPIFSGSRKQPRVGNKKTSPRKLIRVVCPAMLSLHSPALHTKTVKFISEFEKAVRAAQFGSATVHVCFRDTKKIFASGGIYLLARCEVIVNRYRNVKYRVSVPPSLPEPGHIGPQPIAHSVLCQIGFYKLLGIKQPRGAQLPSVDCWYVSSSEKADGEFIGNAIEKLGKTGAEARDLYRSSIEAISNASEHAYSTAIQTDKVFTIKKWWLFSAVLDNEAFFYICDLGHGIPKTLEYTQSPTLLEHIKSLLTKTMSPEQRRGFVEDVHKIKMSTMVKETRTELSYRGKGGGDLKSYISKHSGSVLRIYSNKGAYTFKNKKLPVRSNSLVNELEQTNNKKYETGYNNKHSIEGTVIGWSMPLIVS
ncbi:MAG: hypothetical protein KKF22_17500 [Gammaproteobacteria bacterium]|nr:hypothetical protein [Gammaproteobacteria bacterium]